MAHALTEVSPVVPTLMKLWHLSKMIESSDLRLYKYGCVHTCTQTSMFIISISEHVTWYVAVACLLKLAGLVANQFSLLLGKWHQKGRKIPDSHLHHHCHTLITPLIKSSVTGMKLKPARRVDRMLAQWWPKVVMHALMTYRLLQLPRH